MKHPLLLSALLLALAGALHAQTTKSDSAEAARLAAYQSGVASAYDAYSKSDYARSADLYTEAFTHVRLQTHTDLYNAACAAALAGRVSRAYGFLHMSIERGWENESHMDVDPDLASLRKYPDLWAEVHQAVARAMKKRYGNDFNAELRNELMEINRADQEGRLQFSELQKKYGGKIPDSISTALWKEIAHADSLNLIRVVKIIEKHGWPKRSMVGMQASTVVFLVIQHADLATQEKYLPMVEKAVKDGELHPSNLALLVDRIRMRNGKPQLYGSQLHQDQKTGKMAFYQIEDPANVDKRRKEVGLEPIAEYAKRFGITYEP